jgi:hypothetical protein
MIRSRWVSRPDPSTSVHDWNGRLEATMGPVRS